MRALLFPRDNADLYLPEAAFLEELVQPHFAESEPVIRVKFTRLFESMTQKIENHQAPARFQNPVSSANGALRMNGMVQRLAENCKVDAVFSDGRVLNIAQPVLKILESVFLRQLRPELDHLRRVIDGNNFARSFRQQLRECPLACSQIGDGQRREQRDQRVRKRLPRSPRHIASTEFASEFIEVFPRLILPLLEHKLQTGAIARTFAQFARQKSSDLRYTFTLRVLPVVVRAIINILSHAAISHYAGPLQLSEMTRD